MESRATIPSMKRLRPDALYAKIDITKKHKPYSLTGVYMAFSETWGVQRNLSTAQAFPILGPIFVSPVKALVSVVQLIVGTVAAIIFGSMTIVSSNRIFNQKAFKSSEHAEMGLYGFIYSVSNFMTLGIVGLKIEQMSKP